MRRAKLRAISRMSFRGFASLPRLRGRAIREADSDISPALDAGKFTANLGELDDPFAVIIGIFPGFGTYWECSITVGGNHQTIRSYKLASLIEAVVEMLREYEREIG